MTGLLRKLDFHYKEWMLLVVCIVSIITGILFYPLMPATMASHWGIRGAPNGFMSAFWGSFIMPMVIVVMFLLLIFIPRADPMKKNIDLFKKYFLNFLLILFVFFYALQLFIILWNLDYKIDIIYVIVPLFSVLFFYIGVMLSKAKQNFSIGIRTPWTLKSEKVWDETHRRTAIHLKIISIVFLLGLVFRKQAFIIILIPLLLVFLYSFVYSYVLYAREEKENKSRKKQEKNKEKTPKKDEH